MSDTARPKRPVALLGRTRSRPPMRDARAEPPLEDELDRPASQPPDGPTQPRGARIADHSAAQRAAFESELARLREERGAEADQLATMLVRMAQTERARAGAEQLAESLSQRVTQLETQRDEIGREVQALRQERQQQTERLELVTRRAGLAERSASDGAEALERAHAELEADRARLNELEAKLARLRREHHEEVAALRETHRRSSDESARELAEERAAVAGAMQHAAGVERDLARARERFAHMTDLFEDMERREEMTTALRMRALDQIRQTLGEETAPAPPGDQSDLQPESGLHPVIEAAEAESGSRPVIEAIDAVEAAESVHLELELDEEDVQSEP